MNPARVPSPTQADAATRDERLALILSQLADARAAGRPVDVEAAARSQPDLAAELRELWGAIFVADAAASASRPGSAADKGPAEVAALDGAALERAAIDPTIDPLQAGLSPGSGSSAGAGAPIAGRSFRGSLAIMNCWPSWDAAAWAWSTKPGS